jgi:tRNAThr (cytosine32-N3)-methyltransferase
MDVSSSKQESVAEPDLSTLTLAPGDSLIATDPAQTAETTLPPHLSHDPESNLKRSDPFQFGSRYLSENDNVFEFNAWDHVETDDTYKEYAEQQYAKQREAPVSDFDKSMSPFSPHILRVVCHCILMIESYA